MAEFLEIVALSLVMGFSVYLSLPFLLSKRTSENQSRILNAVAIGILIFIMGDVFADVAGTLYTGSLYGYGSSPFYDAVFGASLIIGFGALFVAGGRSKSGLTPVKMSTIIALGIGFQNLTEGLVFGSLGIGLGITGATLVILVGFILQNITEGFPVASPFLGNMNAYVSAISGLFLIVALPTTIGAAIGYFSNVTALSLFFEGLAVGSILYVILPMLRVQFNVQDAKKVRVSYIGVLLGFLLGFLVNLI